MPRVVPRRCGDTLPNTRICARTRRGRVAMRQTRALAGSEASSGREGTPIGRRGVRAPPRWTASAGIGGRFGSESVDGFNRNGWTIWVGTGGLHPDGKTPLRPAGLRHSRGPGPSPVRRRFFGIGGLWYLGGKWWRSQCDLSRPAPASKGLGD